MEPGSISLWLAAGAVVFLLILAELGKRDPRRSGSTSQAPESDSFGEDEEVTGAKGGQEDEPEEISAEPVAPLRAPAPVSDFTGRSAEADRLGELPARRGSALIVPKRGRKGLGATELALSVAAGLEEEYPDGSVFVDLAPAAGGPLSGEQAMRRVLNAVNPGIVPPGDPEAVGEFYRRSMAERRILVIADNVSAGEQLEALRPPEPCGLLAVAAVEFPAEGIETVVLAALEPEEAVSLLQRLHHDPDVSEESLADLARACRYEPLSLRLAAGSLSPGKGGSIETHVERIEGVGQQRPEATACAVDAAEQLLMTSPARAARWSRLAVFPGSFDRIAGEIIAELDKGDFEEFVARNLLRYDPGEQRAWLHESLVEPARAVGVPDEAAIIKQRHAEYYLRVMIDAESAYTRGGDERMEGLRRFDADRVNIEAGQGWAAREIGRGSPIAVLARDYALRAPSIIDRRLNAAERIPWFDAAAKAAKKMDDAKGERLAAQQLGRARAGSGDIQGAIRAYHRALGIARESGNRRIEARVLYEEALAFEQLGRIDHALTQAVRAEAILEEINDPKAGEVRSRIEQWKQES